MKTLFIKCNEISPIKEWKEQVDSWSNLYFDRTKSEDDDLLITNSGVIDESMLVGKDKVIIFGSNLGKGIKNIAKTVKNATIIENLCCDVTVNDHRVAKDSLIHEGFNVVRDYSFMSEEIYSFVRNVLEMSSGRPSNFDGNTPFYELGYDSLDVVNLVEELEDEYNIYIDKSVFGKLWKFNELPKILAKRGQLSNFYKNR